MLTIHFEEEGVWPVSPSLGQSFSSVAASLARESVTWVVWTGLAEKGVPNDDRSEADALFAKNETEVGFGRWKGIEGDGAKGAASS